MNRDRPVSPPSIVIDEDGECVSGLLMDYLLPTTMEVPQFELGETITPSPLHPARRQGVGESTTLGSPPAVSTPSSTRWFRSAASTPTCPSRQPRCGWPSRAAPPEPTSSSPERRPVVSIRGFRVSEGFRPRPIRKASGDAKASDRFNDGWARRGLGRGAVVVIVSDGWESGDPALLGQEMERLARLVHRVVWVNPRRQSARYQPLAGGMAAALPHVDVFVSGHHLDAMREVIDAIGSDRER